VNCLPNLEELFASSNRLQRIDSLAKCKKVFICFNFIVDTYDDDDDDDGFG